MKKIALLFLALLSLTAQAAVVEGTIQGKQLYTTVSVAAFSENGSFDFVTTRTIQMDGSFYLELEVPATNYYNLTFSNGQKLNRPLFLVLSPEDKVKLTLQSELTHLSIASVEGSAEIQFIAQYQGMSVALMDKMQGFEQDFALAKTDAEKQAIQENFNQLYTQHLAQEEALLMANAQYLGAAFLAYSEFGKDIRSHQKLFETLSAQLSAQYPQDLVLKVIQEGLNNPIALGEMAPEIVMEGLEGETYKLSDLRGKYVLVDFWASWCRPCRMENPNVVKAYQTFHSKGLEVFSVSLDTSKDKWKAAILADGLVWPYHGSTLQGWNCPLAQAYRVSGIPFSVLINPQGKIIAISLRGEELQQKLGELLGK